MCGLINAVASVSDLDRWVQSALADLAWWNAFLRVWNGTSVAPPPEPTWTIVSDASGSWGQPLVPLQEEWVNISIAPKELVPIVVATIYWVGGHVRFLCDNSAVVMAVHCGTAKDPSLLHLLKILALAAAILGIHITAKNLPGAQNTSAVACPGINYPSSSPSTPRLPLYQPSYPQELQSLVFDTQLHWTSPSWMHLLSSSL